MMSLFDDYLGMLLVHIFQKSPISIKPRHYFGALIQYLLTFCNDFFMIDKKHQNFKLVQIHIDICTLCLKKRISNDFFLTYFEAFCIMFCSWKGSGLLGKTLDKGMKYVSLKLLKRITNQICNTTSVPLSKNQGNLKVDLQF